MHTITRTLFLGTLLAILVAACSSGGGTAAPASQAPASERPLAPASAPASEAPASEAPASAAAGGAVTVMVAESSLGQILVDGEGRTLYMFKPDSAGEPTCYDDCADELAAIDGHRRHHGRRGPRRVEVHDGRPDRRQQAGQGRNLAAVLLRQRRRRRRHKGQEKGDVWYVVSPTGEPIEG